GILCRLHLRRRADPPWGQRRHGPARTPSADHRAGDGHLHGLDLPDYYQNQTTSNTYRATVVTSWPSLRARGASATLQVQTVLFSPQGSESCGTATHPFAAPCQAFLYGTASQS